MENEKMQHPEVQCQTYTVQTIADILGISRRSAYAFASETTEFKVVRVGRSLRISRTSFDAWLKGQSAANS